MLGWAGSHCSMHGRRIHLSESMGAEKPLGDAKSRRHGYRFSTVNTRTPALHVLGGQQRVRRPMKDTEAANVLSNTGGRRGERGRSRGSRGSRGNRDGRQTVRLNPHAALHTQATYDSQGRRVRVHGIAGWDGHLGWGFESALWITLDASPGRRDKDPTLMGGNGERLGHQSAGSKPRCGSATSCPWDHAHHNPLLGRVSHQVLRREKWACLIGGFPGVALPGCATRCDAMRCDAPSDSRATGLGPGRARKPALLSCPVRARSGPMGETMF